MENIIQRLKKVKDAWDFVENFYPDYGGSSEIAEEGDYCKIVDGEINGCAEDLFIELASELGFTIMADQIDDFSGEKRIKVVEIAQQRSDSMMKDIYELSILRFLEAEKEIIPQKTYFLFGAEAEGAYSESFENLIEQIEENDLGYAIFEHTEGETSIADFAAAMSGWNDYNIISEEEYKKLAEL